MNIKEISKEDLKQYVCYLTVGELKKCLNESNLKDDALVMIERVEDVYYEKHGWRVYLKEGECTITNENGDQVHHLLNLLL